MTYVALSSPALELFSPSPCILSLVLFLFSSLFVFAYAFYYILLKKYQRVKLAEECICALIGVGHFRELTRARSFLGLVGAGPRHPTRRARDGLRHGTCSHRLRINDVLRMGLRREERRWVRRERWAREGMCHHVCPFLHSPYLVPKRLVRLVRLVIVVVMMMVVVVVGQEQQILCSFEVAHHTTVVWTVTCRVGTYWFI